MPWYDQFAGAVGESNASISSPHELPVAHVAPQTPQLASSVFVSAQTFPQRVRPVSQTQPPFVHVLSAGQTAPHMPQLASSVFVSVHAMPHAV
jgi:hypothetical protein